MRQVQQKWLIRMLLNKLDRFFGQPVRQIFVFRCIGEFPNVSVWRIVASGRTAAVRSGEIEIETSTKRLDSRSAHKLLTGADVVIDALDNSASRQVVQEELSRLDNVN